MNIDSKWNRNKVVRDKKDNSKKKKRIKVRKEWKINRKKEIKIELEDVKVQKIEREKTENKKRYSVK